MPTPAKNKAIARRINDEIINEKKFNVVDEVIAPNFVSHMAPEGAPPGPDGFKQGVQEWLRAFPDTYCTIEHEIAEGDKVVTRVNCTATMTGEFMGAKPTNKRAEWSETHTTRFEDGKAVEHWLAADFSQMMQEFGIQQPQPSQAAA
jgi:predicted ester cyclase